MVEWTEDRIAALSDQDLKNLLINAERKSAANLTDMCTAEQARRHAAKPRNGPKPRSEIKEFEHQMSAQLAEVGKRMAEKYDLSEASAKAKSEGVKGFRAHKLLDSQGHAKLGGMQRDGSVAIDRYISHRRGNATVSLGVFLPKEKPVEMREFQVIAPLTLLDGGKPVAEIRPGNEKHQPFADGALAFQDFEQATEAFDRALQKIIF